jgi:lysophospholipase L1-like esterase
MKCGRSVIFIIKKISFLILAFIFFLTFSFPAEVLAADTFYYTALGDSISYGTEHSSFFMEHPNAYPNLIRDKLQKSGKNVVFDNVSLPGATTAVLLDQLSTDSFTQQAVEKATLITISIGGNDVLYAGVYSGYTEIRDEIAKEGIKSFCDNIPKIIEKINSLNKKKPTILVMNLYSPYHPLEWGSVIYADGSIENGYLHDMIYKKYLITMQNKLTELSKEYKNVKIVDTYRSFESSSRFSNVTTIAAHDSPNGIIYSSFFYQRTACTDTYTNFYKYPYEPFNMPFMRDLHPTITGQQLIAEEHWKVITDSKIIK